MASVTREKLGNLHDKLVVKVAKEDYLPSFEKSLKGYSKKANIPGFRKGKVPTGMIKKMYGSAFFQEEVLKSVEKELQEYLEKEKPEIFAQPLPLENEDLVKLDMNKPDEYNFPFEIGLKPEVSHELLSKAKLTSYKVKVSPEMLDEEIENLVTKNGDLIDEEMINSPENVVNVLFEECDADKNIVENGITKDDSLIVKYFTEKYQKELQGKKVDDTLVLKLNEAFEEKEREWILNDLGLTDTEDGGEKYFKIKLIKIGKIEKKELNEEFFKLVFPDKELKTGDEFRKTLQTEIQKQWDAASRNQLQDQIYHAVIDSPVDLPADFLKRWLEMGGQEKKSTEEVEKDFPDFKKQLVWNLLTDKIAADQKIDIQPDEIREQIRQDLMGYFGSSMPAGDMGWMDSYIDKMMSDRKQIENTYQKLMAQKVLLWLESQVTPEKKDISAEDFRKLVEEHTH